MIQSSAFMGMLAAVLLSGCAHKIQITPSLETIRNTSISEPREVTVGYFIPADKRSAAVITPGGGGGQSDVYPLQGR